MSKNLSDIFPPTEIGGGGGGGGEFVHIGANPPASPEEGQQWMEVPASGDATMWIYDGDKWLQHPSGKDGAPGADGNIADATEQGVIATWDSTAGQWTPEGGVVVSGGNVGIGTDNPVSALQVSNNGNEGYEVRPVGIDNAPLHLNFNRSNASYLKQTVRAAEYDWQYPNPSGGSPISAMRIDANGKLTVNSDTTWAHMSLNGAGDGSLDIKHYDNTAGNGAIVEMVGGGGLRIFTGGSETMRIAADGRVDITGSLYVNGTPKIGTSELIDTLSTLRNATKDETTVKGLRDAIGNAVGGLIEKFEAMQSTATQEIADE